MTAWKRPLLRVSFLLQFCLVFLVGGSEIPRHGLKVEPVTRVARIFKAGIPETLQKKGDPLEAIPAMAIPAVTEKADHGLVDLHAGRRLWTIGRNRALRALRRNCAGPIRDQEPDQDLQWPGFRLG